MTEFFHVGFSKCASTYLQSVFQANSSINLIYKSNRFSLLSETSGKEVSYSDKINVESDEHILMPSWHPTLHRVRTCRLDDVKLVAERIHQYNADSKIIVVVRNQVSLLKSRYSQYIVGSGGSLDIGNFAKELLGPEGGDCFFQNFYSEILQILESKFGSENVLMLFHEDLTGQSENALEALSKFFGEIVVLKKPGILNQRKGLNAKGLGLVAKINSRFVSPNQPIAHTVRTKVPHSVYTSSIRLVRAVDYFQPTTRVELPAEIAQAIEDRFKEDNRKLAASVNRDLHQLGYVYD